MRPFLISLLLLLASDIFFQSCANIGNPSGGPRDTIPPVLLSSTPENGTINFKSQEIILEFSEFVKTDKIQQQLIITPITENKYKTTIKKQAVILKFEEPFDDSTTYNLNFADGITDITENNPAINLSLAFSTGPFIDSLSIEGTVKELFEQEEAKGYTVALYPNTDTLDYFTQKPSYFTTTNDSGLFELNYIKSDTYKMLVFDDENNNIILDPESEPHGFVQDSIVLDSMIQLERTIQTVLQNVKPITFINSRPTGPYIELKYSKHISSYSVEPTSLQHNITGESKDVIRIYKSENAIIGDSIVIYTTANDSLGNSTQDTIKTAFVESNREPAAFNYSVQLPSSNLQDQQQLKFTFNKPIDQLDTTKIYIGKDSTFQWNFNASTSWNENRTKLTLITDILTDEVYDSLRASMPQDSAELNETNSQLPSSSDLPSLAFVIEQGAFISIENDSSSSKSVPLSTKESTSFGKVKLFITSRFTSYNVQLVDKNGKVQYSVWNEKEITFSKVKPDKYAIRVLIDNNNDGKWSAGNLLLNKIPEDIFIYEEETSVRENWDVNIDISF